MFSITNLECNNILKMTIQVQRKIFFLVVKEQTDMILRQFGNPKWRCFLVTTMSADAGYFCQHYRVLFHPFHQDSFAVKEMHTAWATCLMCFSLFKKSLKKKKKSKHAKIFSKINSNAQNVVFATWGLSASENKRCSLMISWGSMGL